MRYTYTLLCILLCLHTHAQRQNNNWILGKYTGLNIGSFFTYTTKANISENGAIVSDAASGNLLFYTDGQNVWDKNHDGMPNGYAMGQDNNGTSAQGAVIIPTAKKANTYYLFTVGDKDHSGQLQYSEIDMALNGGLGDVVVATKNTILGDGYTEAMTTVALCDMMWVLAIKRYSNEVHAFQVTAKGVTGPVISKLGYGITIPNVATMKISPDKRYLSIATHHTRSYLAIHDFDIITGAVTNGTLIDSSGNECFYGSEFSPDNSKLYAAELKKAEVYQYDMTLPAAQVGASRKTIYTGTPGLYDVMGALQLGPDSNIYLALPNESYLARISTPNSNTPTYVHHAVNLGSYKAGYGLPQPVPQVGIALDTLPGTLQVIYLCKDSTRLLKARSAAHYIWHDGSRDSTYFINKGGSYSVSTIKDCILLTDTFYVEEVKLSLDLGLDSFICSKDTITLHAGVQKPGTTYAWNTGATTPTLRVTEPGLYTLSIAYNGCATGDAIQFRSIRIPTLVMGDDDKLCDGEEKILPRIGPVGDTVKFLWSDGSTGRELKVTQSGTYSVSITNRCNETVKGSVRIDFRNCKLYYPNAFSPNGDGLNDVIRIRGDLANVSNYTIRISNRYGQAVFTSQNINDAWDGKLKGKVQPMGTYYYIITYNYMGKEEILKGDITLVW